MISKPLFVSLVLACLFLSSSYAQESATKEKKLSINEQSQVEKAQYLYEQKNYRLAMPIFEKILETHPSDNRVKYFTALCYASRPDKHPLMLQYLMEVYTANKKADKIEYEIARAYFFNYKFDDASDYLNKYTSKAKKADKKQQGEINKLSTYIKNAKALVANPVNVKTTNLGNVVNTPAIEYSPYVDMNDTLLVYTYSGPLSTGGLQNAYSESDKNGLYYEDVFTSTKINDVWTNPQGISILNTNNNDAALSISYDGTMLFISRDTPEDDGDIYMSRWTGNGWGAAVKLRGDVNTLAWEDNCSLSPDGRTLYFCSSRPGGYGGKDLYKSILQPDSSWGIAQNLGDKINTTEDEDDPFIHLDGKLFLFSSKGHNSMGGYDIFKTYLNPVDSTWSVPENMGYPINTTDDDIHYSLSPGGDKGYYGISKPDGFGDVDLYNVEPGIMGVMPAMLIVKGTISLNNQPVEGNIEVLANNGVYKKCKSNAASGFYQIVLPLGQDYKIAWRLNDTLIQTETLEATTAKEYLLKIKDIGFKTTRDTLVANAGPTAAGNEVVEGLIYKIQVAAHHKNRNVDYKKVKAFGKIEKTVVDDNPRFMLSKEYQTLNQINEALEQVRKIAVPDAFVICYYKGKRCYLYELWKQGIILEEKK
jgi:hypothetical protein